jgi:flagellar hook-associated protein 2
VALINIGGLATGLDTNKIVSQLVALERQRSVGLLETQRLEAQGRQIALQTFNTKVLAFRTAVEQLRSASDVIAKSATSSNGDLVTATAGKGALNGVTALTVSALARGAIATATTGTSGASAAVASGSGSFAFQVGSGAVQSVALDASTTLEGLAASINELGAGVTASVINIGTAATPDFRLHLATQGTGTSNALTVITDDTTLGLAVTQTAANASFTLSGFADPLSRETNTFDDVLPGVTLELRGTGGPATIAVGTDVDATTARVSGVVDAFNEIVKFFAAESVITQDAESEDRTIQAGPLAFDRTVRTILDTLRGKVSDTIAGLSGTYSLLTELGIDTQQNGTLVFDQAEFKTALAGDENGVAALFGGAGGVDGVADRLYDFLTGITESGGLIEIGTKTVKDRIASLEERILAGERNLNQFEANLQASFVSLEVLVGSLQSQGAFLESFFGGNKS